MYPIKAFWLAIACSLIGVVGQAQDEQRLQPRLETTVFSFGCEGLELEARIVAPPKELQNGYGVLMIGGGIGNDLNWSVPGILNEQGTAKQVTISGKPHNDAPRIARALAIQGFIVMHWSTIDIRDPQRDRWPYEATYRSGGQLFEFSQSALAAFRQRNLFPAENVFLLGHSLGAVRAANLAYLDRSVRGLVLLAPAQVTRTACDDQGRNRNASDASRFLDKVDRNHDQQVTAAEFLQWKQSAGHSLHPLACQSFDCLDFFSDGVLVTWEISAGLARSKRCQCPVSSWKERDRFNLRWTEDILFSRNPNALLLFGSLDSSQSHHAPIISDLVQSYGLTHVTLKLMDGVGHQLGREKHGRIAPISQRTCETVAQWLRAQIHCQGSDLLSH